MPSSRKSRTRYSRRSPKSRATTGERMRVFVRVVASAVILGASAMAMMAFSLFGNDFFPAYRSWSKAVEGGLATVTSFSPVAVWDWAAAALVAWAVASLVHDVRRHRVGRWLSGVLLVVSVLAGMFVAGWGLNHYAPPLADELGLEVAQYSEDQLADAMAYYLDQAAARAPQVPRDADDHLVRQDFEELAATAGSSYAGLADKYAIFAGSTAPVKELALFGEPLLASGHTGMFFSPTGESTVPANVAVAEEPFTMCHEAAHRLGLARENEANFAAFLACTEGAASGDVRFAYAGYYDAFCYCLNALWSVDPDRAQQVVTDAAAGEHGEGVRLVVVDRNDTIDHYQAYKGEFQEVGRTVNDTYLRGFGNDAGIRSYGLVVDYLIAWHLR